MKSLDLDLPVSWPRQLRQLAEDAVGTPGCTTTRYIDDVRPPVHIESAIEAVVATRGILAFHCTRLLDCEVADIRANGIRPASEGLLESKLAYAIAEGYISDEQAEHLRSRSVLTAYPNQRRSRLNKLCALTIRRTLDLREARVGLRRFFTRWGGEITYWCSMDGWCQRVPEQVR